MLGAAVAPASAAYTPPQQEDLSGLSWTEAFDALVTKMSREYAFTDWKGIDWTALSREYRPRIVAAQQAQDSTAYLIALREFTHETHDGHVQIKGLTDDVERSVRRQVAGGGFGLVVSRLSDGKVAATWVQRGGPAWKAGMRVGDRVLAWNGRPIDAALRATSTAMAPNQPTRARISYEQTRFLVRAPIGAGRTVAFKSPGDAHRTKVRLRAIDDGEKTLALTSASSIFSKGWPTDMVTSKILPGNVGYLRILAEIDLPADKPGDHTPTLQQYRAALRDFRARGVRKLIVDIRGNGGGEDQMVADMMSSFYRSRSFYEYQNFIVPGTGVFQIWQMDEQTGAFVRRNVGVWIEPGSRPFNGKIVTLIDNGCISSCEGVAMGLSRLPNAKLVGFTGTNGSFGMVGDGVLMPLGQYVSWPFGQSLNKSKTVQIDSRNGVGGVAPDVRVPTTVQTVSRSLRGNDVLLKKAQAMLR